jgi:hypothetical protein
MGYPKILFDNRLADATPVASSTATGNYAAANVNDMRPYTWWKGSAMPASLTVNCGSAKAADSALIYGHDLFTQGATCEVRGSTDNFASSNVLVATVTPANNNPFLISFGSVSYQYWRFNFTGATNPSIAIGLIGAAFVMPTYLNNDFDPITRTAIQQANNNENGYPLGKIIDFELWKQTLQFDLISWAWLRSTWQPAWRSNLRGQPVVVAWDSVNYPAEIQLVSVGDSYQTPHINGQIANLSFDVSGVAT